MTNYFIIGSVALKYHFPDYTNTPKDMDYLIPKQLHEFKPKQVVVEQHESDVVFNIIKKYNSDSEYLDPNLLYTLKVSHVSWEGKNGKWWKHLKDIAFLRRKGCTLQKEVFSVLYAEWCRRFGDKKHITFNKPTEEFFKDSVKREVEHDKLHDYLKLTDVPAYSRMLTSSDSALCSEELFYGLPKNYKFYTALEEISVISLERRITYQQAYKALVTKMSKGFWNLFLIENVELILDGFKEEREFLNSKIIEWRELNES